MLVNSYVLAQEPQHCSSECLIIDQLIFIAGKNEGNERINHFARREIA